MKTKLLLFFIPLILAFAFTFKEKPVLYIIGDSTVKTGAGKGENDMWGWGSYLPDHFDTTRIHIENHAIGGRSSRTFLTDGRWDKILPRLKKGDFVIMQFGHNDDWAINDTLRARGTIKGIGEEKEEIDNVITKKHEVVHTFGWYMRKYVTETQQKGATAIICSRVPGNSFENGKLKRKQDYYPLWSAQVANQTGAFFIDLFELSGKVYEEMGTEKVKAEYFTPKDNTHTNAAGAKLNAAKVVEGLKSLKKCKLTGYLK